MKTTKILFCCMGNKVSNLRKAMCRAGLQRVCVEMVTPLDTPPLLDTPL
ncbi:MAG: hypothetical protein Q7S51_11105 [Gallionellaceae bacterium]|nr:hypothetical protein [Gallionellaceae bacterium]